MNLYEKYRPPTLAEVKGNKEVVSSVGTMLQDPWNKAHVFLFHGGTGCGKTTLARVMKNHLSISDEDYLEIDSAQFNGIDMVRDLRKKSQFKPLNSDFRMIVIDECHQLSGAAQEGMLKILEDTPKHIYFILCTTDPQKLKAALKGRCKQFQMMPLTPPQMKGLLKGIVRDEDDYLEKEVYDQIIADADGHPRNAIQVLEQVLNTAPENRLEAAKAAEVVQSKSIELCQVLMSNNGWKKAANILLGLKGQDIERIRHGVMGYAQAVLLKGGTNDKAALIIEEFKEPFYSCGFPGLTYACYSIMNN